MGIVTRIGLGRDRTRLWQEARDDAEEDCGEGDAAGVCGVVVNRGDAMEEGNQLE
jgi:hypothetical protein